MPPKTTTKASQRANRDVSSNSSHDGDVSDATEFMMSESRSAVDVIATQHNRHPMNSSKFIVHYNGSSEPLAASVWLSMYERRAERHRCSDADKLMYFDSFLDSKAIKWFAKEDAKPGRRTWSQMRANFLRRFDKGANEPITRLIEFNLSKDMDIETYFEEKLLIAEGLPLEDTHLIEFLNYGLPQHYRSHMKGARPRTLGDWLDTAQGWELECKRQNRRYASTQNTSSSKFIKNGHKQDQTNQTNKPAKRLPPSPCSICARFYNKPNEMHWRNDCPNKRATVNVGDIISDGDSQGNESSDLRDN